MYALSHYLPALEKDVETIADTTHNTYNYIIKFKRTTRYTLHKANTNRTRFPAVASDLAYHQASRLARVLRQVETLNTEWGRKPLDR